MQSTFAFCPWGSYSPYWLQPALSSDSKTYKWSNSCFIFLLIQFLSQFHSSLIESSATLGTTPPLLQIHCKQTFRELPNPRGDTLNRALNVCFLMIKHDLHSLSQQPPAKHFIFIFELKKDGKVLGCGDDELSRQEVILLH